MHDTEFTVSGWAKDTNTNPPGNTSVILRKGDGTQLQTIPVNAANGAFSATQLANFYTPPFWGSQNQTINMLTVPKSGQCGGESFGSRTLTITNAPPTNGNITINPGRSAKTEDGCVNGNCNGDIVLDASDYDTGSDERQFRIRATFTDTDTPASSTNRVTDLRNAWIAFDNDGDQGNGVDYLIKWTNPADGTISGGQVAEDSGVVAQRFKNQIALENTSATLNGNTLTVEATINLSGLACNQYFGGYVYLLSQDFVNVYSGGWDKKSEYLDFWNGRCTHVNIANMFAPSTPNDRVDVRFTTPESCSYDADDTWTHSIGFVQYSSVDLPYKDYGGVNNCTLTISSGTEGNYLYSSQFQTLRGFGITNNTGEHSQIINEGGSWVNNTGSRDVNVSIADNYPLWSRVDFVEGTTTVKSCTPNCPDRFGLITDVDSLGNNNQKVTMKLYLDDPETGYLPVGVPQSRQTDMQEGYVEFQSSDGATIYARLRFTASRTGGGATFTPEYLNDTIIATGFFESYSVTRSGDNSVITVALDLSKIRRGNPFSSRMVAAGTDWGEENDTVVLFPSVDLWNGRELEAYYRPVLSQAGSYSKATTLTTTIPSTCQYNFNDEIDTDFDSVGTKIATFSAAIGQTKRFFMPYVHYRGTNACRVTYQSAGEGYYLVSADSTPVGGLDAVHNGTARVANQSIMTPNDSNTPVLLRMLDEAPSFAGINILTVSDNAAENQKACTITTTTNNCGSWDFIESTDSCTPVPGNSDKKVFLTFRVSDPQNSDVAWVPPVNKVSDIRTYRVSMRNATNNQEIASITFRDNGNGFREIEPLIANSDVFDPGTSGTDLFSNASVLALSGDVIGFRVRLDLSRFRDAPLRTRFSVTATDFAGATSNFTMTPPAGQEDFDTWTGITSLVPIEIQSVAQSAVSATCSYTEVGNPTVDIRMKYGSQINIPVVPPVAELPFVCTDTGAQVPIDFYLNQDSQYYLLGMDASLVGGPDCASVNTSTGEIENISVTKGGDDVTNNTTDPVTFFVTQYTQPWFQARGGIVQVNSNALFDSPTDRCTLPSCYINTAGSGTDTGFTLTQGTITGRGKDRMSNPNRYAQELGGNLIGEGYPSYVAMRSALEAAPSLTYIPGGTGTLTINGAAVATYKNKVTLTDRNVAVNSNITIDENTEFMIIVTSGTITIGENVTQMEGIFIADGGFIINDEGHESYTEADTTGQLSVTGALLSSDDFTMNRTLGVANNINPAVIVNYSPTIVSNFLNAAMNTGAFLYESKPIGEE